MQLKESVHSYILNEKNELLLVKRRDVPVWVLPGGGIDQGETPEEAAIRETYEESGLQITIKRKIAFYTPISSLASPSHVFEGTILSGKLQKSLETSQVQFFSLKNLPREIPPPFPDWIADAKTNSPTLIEKKIFSVTYWNLFKHAITHPILVARFVLARCGFTINT